MTIPKVNTTLIVNMIIKEQLNQLPLTGVKWKVDEMLYSIGIDPATVPIEKKQFIVSQWKAKIQTMIDKL